MSSDVCLKRGTCDSGTVSRGPKRVHTTLHDGDGDLLLATGLPDVFSYGARLAIQGGRPYQEDYSTIASVRLPCISSSSSASSRAASTCEALVAAVFDGHGGSCVAQLCAANITSLLGARLANCSSVGGDVSTQSLERALKGSFDDIDKLIAEQSASTSDICTDQTHEGGSTALVALVGQSSISTAHCGDSRAVLSRNKEAVELTHDHKPEDKLERERIERAGGHVFWNGGFRVMGVLAMSRALGDRYLQKYGLTPEPEVHSFLRSPDDDFMILASDGLWGKVSNQDAVELAHMALKCAAAQGVTSVAAAKLVTRVLINAAQQRGSNDNITVVFVDLSRGNVNCSCEASSTWASTNSVPAEAFRLGLVTPAAAQDNVSAKRVVPTPSSVADGGSSAGHVFTLPQGCGLWQHGSAVVSSSRQHDPGWTGSYSTRQLMSAALPMQRDPCGPSAAPRLRQTVTTGQSPGPCMKQDPARQPDSIQWQWPCVSKPLPMSAFQRAALSATPLSVFQVAAFGAAPPASPARDQSAAPLVH